MRAAEWLGELPRRRWPKGSQVDCRRDVRWLALLRCPPRPPPRPAGKSSTLPRVHVGRAASRLSRLQKWGNPGPTPGLIHSGRWGGKVSQELSSVELGGMTGSGPEVSTGTYTPEKYRENFGFPQGEEWEFLPILP